MWLSVRKLRRSNCGCISTCLRTPTRAAKSPTQRCPTMLKALRAYPQILHTTTGTEMQSASDSQKSEIVKSLEKIISNVIFRLVFVIMDCVCDRIAIALLVFSLSVYFTSCSNFISFLSGTSDIDLAAFLCCTRYLLKLFIYCLFFIVLCFCLHKLCWRLCGGSLNFIFGLRVFTA